MEPTQQSEKNPFAGFQSEEFDRGEPVEPKEPVARTDKEGEVAAPAAKAAEPKQDEEEDGASAPAGEPAPRKSAQERINEVTRARREAERRADAAEQRARDLEARMNAAPAPKEEPAKREPVEEDPTAPKPEAYEYGELDSRYIRDLARHEANKTFAELRQQDAQEREKSAREERQNAARTQFEAMIDRGSKVHEDFYEKVVIGSEKGEWPLSEALGSLLLESEVGNDVAYHLATHPEEADRVYRSSPVEQARYFGRMEAKFSAGQAAASGDDPGKPAPRTPKAPPPVETARGASGQFQATADTDDFAAFEARAKTER